MTAEIEGDHLVAAVWRERLHLFWVTFVEVADRSTETRNPTELAEVPADELLAPNRIDAHLHWTEYYQGEWTDPVSDGLTTPVTTVVRDPAWSPAIEAVHVSHDGDALLVHLSGRVNQAFRVESKNSPPVLDAVLPPPEVPYSSGLQILVEGQPRLVLPFAVEYVDRITRRRNDHTAGALHNRTDPRARLRLHRSGSPPTNSLASTLTSPRWSARCFSRTAITRSTSSRRSPRSRSTTGADG